MNLRNLTYAALRVSNDARAVRRGKVPQRIGRRFLGRLLGRLFR